MKLPSSFGANMPRKNRPFQSLLLERLADPDLARHYLNEALAESYEAFLKALKAVAQAAEAKQTGNCVDCGLPAIPRCYSEEGIKEFAISGLCEVCFDEATAEVQDDLIEEDDIAF